MTIEEARAMVTAEQEQQRHQCDNCIYNKKISAEEVNKMLGPSIQITMSSQSTINSCQLSFHQKINGWCQQRDE